MQLKIKQLLLASLLGAVAGGSKTTVSPIYGVDAAAADFAQGAERILSFALAKSEDKPDVVARAIQSKLIVNPKLDTKGELTDGSVIEAEVTVPEGSTFVKVRTLLGDHQAITELSEVIGGESYKIRYTKSGNGWIADRQSVVSLVPRLGRDGIPAMQQAIDIADALTILTERVVPNAVDTALTNATGFAPIATFVEKASAGTFTPARGALADAIVNTAAGSGVAVGTAATLIRLPYNAWSDAVIYRLVDRDIIPAGTTFAELMTSRFLIKQVVKFALEVIGLDSEQVAWSLNNIKWDTSTFIVDTDHYYSAEVPGVSADLFAKAKSVYDKVMKIVPGITHTGATAANTVDANTTLDLTELAASASLGRVTAESTSTRDKAIYKTVGECLAEREATADAATAPYVWIMAPLASASILDPKAVNLASNNLTLNQALGLGGKLTYNGKAVITDVTAIDWSDVGQTLVAGQTVILKGDANVYAKVPAAQQTAIANEAEAIRKQSKDMFVIINTDGSKTTEPSSFGSEGTVATYYLKEGQAVVYQKAGKTYIKFFDPKAQETKIVVTYESKDREKVVDTNYVGFTAGDDVTSGLKGTNAEHLGKIGVPAAMAPLTLDAYLKSIQKTQAEYGALSIEKQHEIDVAFVAAKLAHAKRFADLSADARAVLSKLSVADQEILLQKLLSKTDGSQDVVVVIDSMKPALEELGPKVIGEVNALKDVPLFDTITKEQLVATIKKTASGANLADDKLTAAAEKAIKARDDAKKDVEAKKAALVTKATEANKAVKGADAAFIKLANDAGVDLADALNKVKAGTPQQAAALVKGVSDTLGVQIDNGGYNTGGKSSADFIKANLDKVGLKVQAQAGGPAEEKPAAGAYKIAAVGAKAGTDDASTAGLSQAQLDAGWRKTSTGKTALFAGLVVKSDAASASTGATA